MQSLIEGVKVISELVPGSYSSATSGDWISMKNYDKVTFILTCGTMTAGGNVIVQEAKNVSGSSAATLTFNHYYKMTASTDTYTKTSADSSGSADCITVANADDSKIFMVEVKADQLSDSFDCINMKVPAALSSASLGIVAIAHQSRYAEDSSPTALTN